MIEPARHYFDGFMQKHFRGWEESGAYTDKIWTGSKSFGSYDMKFRFKTC
jgi:hypothetical protein